MPAQGSEWSFSPQKRGAKHPPPAAHLHRGRPLLCPQIAKQHRGRNSSWSLASNSKGIQKKKSPAAAEGHLISTRCSLESGAWRQVEVCKPQENLLLTCSEFGACSVIEKELITLWLCGFYSKRGCGALVKNVTLAWLEEICGWGRCGHKVQRLQENGLSSGDPHL